MKYVKPVCRDALFKEGFFWFFDNRIQALCKMNSNDFQIQVLSQYKSMRPFTARWIYSFNDEFFFADDYLKRILSCKKEKNEYIFSLEEFVPDKESVFMERQWCMVCQWRNRLYYFSCNLAEKVVYFDLSERKFIVLGIIDDKILNKFYHKELGRGSVCGNEIWFSVRGTPYYIVYNFLNGKAESFNCKNKDISLDRICFDGKNIWMTQTNQSNIVLNDKDVIEIPGTQTYTWLYAMQHYVAVLPFNGDILVLINKKTKEAEALSLPLSDIEKQHCKKNYLSYCHETSDSIYFLPNTAYGIFVYDICSKKIFRKNCHCSEYMNAYRNLGRVIEEDFDTNLEAFLS